MRRQAIIDECEAIRRELLAETYPADIEEPLLFAPGLNAGHALLVRASDEARRLAGALSAPEEGVIQGCVRALAKTLTMWLALCRDRTTEMEPFDPAEG